MRRMSEEPEGLAQGSLTGLSDSGAAPCPAVASLQGDVAVASVQDDSAVDVECAGAEGVDTMPLEHDETSTRSQLVESSERAVSDSARAAAGRLGSARGGAPVTAARQCLDQVRACTLVRLRVRQAALCVCTARRRTAVLHGLCACIVRSWGAIHAERCTLRQSAQATQDLQWPCLHGGCRACAAHTWRRGRLL